MPITVNIDPNEKNHIRYEYIVENIFLNFPNQQRYLTFVNGTSSERTIAAGTLVGITSADQTLGKALKSDASDGSDIPFGFLLYDTFIAAGASEEVEALVGFGDDKSSIYYDEVVLEKSGDTLETLITNQGMSIFNAIAAFTRMKVEPSAQNVSAPKDTQV